jgi:hypothetical protein
MLFGECCIRKANTQIQRIRADEKVCAEVQREQAEAQADAASIEPRAASRRRATPAQPPPRLHTRARALGLN